MIRGMRKVSLSSAQVGGEDWSLRVVLIGTVGYAGSEGAPAKGGMNGVLDDTKRKAEELMGKGS